MDRCESAEDTCVDLLLPPPFLLLPRPLLGDGTDRHEPRSSRQASAAPPEAGGREEKAKPSGAHQADRRTYGEKEGRREGGKEEGNGNKSSKHG